MNVQKNIRENVQGNIQEDVRENIRENVHETIREDVQRNIQEDVRENIRKNVRETIREDVQRNIEDIRENIQEKIQKSIRGDVRKILIFGGTTEGRVLADLLSREGFLVTVSCATELGAEELRGISCRVLCGRLDAARMTELVCGFDFVADATHPYAAEATANIRLACTEAKIPLRRILRQAGEAKDCLQVRNCREAAEYLQNTEGNILLTTGSKELSSFSILPPERLYARVLPTHATLDACEEIHLPHRNILALQGPFRQEMNEAMIEQYQIRWLVTKNSGKPGGFEEKTAAAQKKGARVIIVERPDDVGISMEEFISEVNVRCR